MFVLRVIDALEAARVPHALAGGYAVALHGAVRGTVDVDLVLSLREGPLDRARRALESLGLSSRLPLTAGEVAHFRQEYVERRNLLAWSFVNPEQPSEIVDLLLTYDLKELKTTRIAVDGRRIRVVSLADMIRMKKASGRPQDLADIDALQRIRDQKGRKR